MSSLRKLVSENAIEIRDGICNVIFYKVGRSWESCEIWSDLMNADSCAGWDPKDVAEMARIAEIDPNAVVINGYYCGHLGENMTVAELEQGIRWHYEEGSTQVRDLVADYYAENTAKESKNGQTEPYKDEKINYTEFLRGKPQETDREKLAAMKQSLVKALTEKDVHGKISCVYYKDGNIKVSVNGEYFNMFNSKTNTFFSGYVGDYAENQTQETQGGQQNSSAENVEPTTTADKAYFEGATSLQAHTSGNIPNLFKIKEPRLVRCHGPPGENRLDL